MTIDHHAWDPTPQTDPDLFTSDEIRAEILHLVKLDRRYGAHPLRALARVHLFASLASALEREAAQ